MKYYKVSEEELLILLKDSRWLAGLENAGVDNWGGCEMVSYCLERYPEPTRESIAEEYDEVV